MSELSGERVTRSSPCAVCEGTDWCMRLTRFHWCMRIESNKPHAKGGWLHPKDADSLSAPLPPKPKRVPDEERRKQWESIAESCHRFGIDRLNVLALQLGVSFESLRALQVGYSANLQGTACWTFPERNEQGWIIGINRRLVTPRGDKTKMCCKGSGRGLVYSDAWFMRPGPIYLVEGGSDVAAGLTMGLCVIGRPSNIGGISHLTKMLKNSPRALCVVGELDRRSAEYLSTLRPPHDPTCAACPRCWPGKSGMIDTAKRLSRSLRRRVGSFMPPAKDLRTWLNQSGVNPNDKNECLALGEKWKELAK